MMKETQKKVPRKKKITARVQGDSSPAVSKRPLNRSELLLAFFLLIAVFTAYLPALSSGFIWDDDDYLTQNSAVQTDGGLSLIWLKPGATPQYYPAVFTSFYVEYRLWGLNPVAYHGTNIVLHFLNAILFYLLLRLLGVPGAAAAAFIFALHPVCVESVAWISERKNVLSTFFYLASALAFLRARRLRILRAKHRRVLIYLSSLLLFAFALLSKTVTFSLPFALLILIWWKDGKWRRKDLIEVLPMVMMGAATAGFTIWMERHVVGVTNIDLGLSIPGRFALAGKVIFFYAAKILVPVHLSFIYPRWNIGGNPGRLLLYPTALIVLSGLLWQSRKHIGRAPIAVLGLFGLTLFPALGFIDVFPMRYSFVADHFQYLALFAPIAFLSAGSATLFKRPPFQKLHPGVPHIIVGALVVALGVSTFSQAEKYESPEKLWRATLKTNPSAWLAHNNLGTILFKQGQLKEAREHFEEALRLHPEAVEALVSLGYCHARDGDLDLAVDLYKRALKIKPSDTLCLTNLGAALLRQGRNEEAIGPFRRALQLHPTSANIHHNLAAAYARAGDLLQAARGYDAALKLSRNNIRWRLEYARILEVMGQRREALQQLHLARDLAATKGDQRGLRQIQATLDSLQTPTPPAIVGIRPPSGSN